jgi:hypothetical protein
MTEEMTEGTVLLATKGQKNRLLVHISIVPFIHKRVCMNQNNKEAFLNGLKNNTTK